MNNDDQTQPPSLPQFSKQQAMMDQAALLSFVDDLVREKKNEVMKPEDAPMHKAQLLKEVNEAINVHLLNLLSEDDQKELDTYLDQNPKDEEISAFFMKKITSLDVEIAAALLNFRSAYLYDVNANRQSQPPSLDAAPVE